MMDIAIMAKSALKNLEITREQNLLPLFVVSVNLNYLVSGGVSFNV